MSMTRPRPASTESIFASHEKRILQLERRSGGPWIVIGTVGAPPFLNGWANQGGSKVPLRFRWLYDYGTEWQGAITGGTLGLPACTVPLVYAPDFDIPIDGSDNPGNYLRWMFLTTGDLVPGS